MNELLKKIVIALIIIMGGVMIVSKSNKEKIDPGSAEIMTYEILEHIKYLSSDKLEGRFPGSEGSKKAIKYISKNWEAQGVLPAGTKKYEQPFSYISKVSLGNRNILRVRNSKSRYKIKKDFIPIGWSGNGNIDDKVVFVGYGFDIDDSLSWNDYINVNVKNKWVLMFLNGPDGNSPHSPYGYHKKLYNKVIAARDRGVGGILFMEREEKENNKLKPLVYRQSASSAGLPIIQITHAVANNIINDKDKTVTDLRSKIDQELASFSFELDRKVSARVNLKFEKETATNVIGFIEGSDPILNKEYIIVGAHYDHLGYGGHMSGSLNPDSMQIHNGADDNASGIAGILELSHKLMMNKKLLGRSIIAICFDAEEKGLLGSKFYTQTPTKDLEQTAIMINMDMIGRLNEKPITVGGVGSAKTLSETIEVVQKNHTLKIDKNISGMDFGRSDHASFYREDIPVLFFFTGAHQDYHKPSDDWDKIDYQGEKEVLNFVYDLIVQLSTNKEKPIFTEIANDNSDNQSPSFNVTLGVIPSYGSQKIGMEIDGISRKNGPADKAGIKKGDIIIEINNKKIRNIYDYMARLAELNSGDKIIVKIIRNKIEMELILDL
tara:strand:- start:6904 stop:8721 length:1818 start_codon:yes stop_codon:yes gene_type:complete